MGSEENRRSFFKQGLMLLGGLLTGLWGCTQGMREGLLKIWNERGGASKVINAKNIPPAIPYNISKEEGMRFLVLGDWGFGDENQKKVAKAMLLTSKQFGCDNIISTGDNFYPTGVTGIADEQWQRKFIDIYNKIGLTQTFYSSLGNHDYYGNEKAEVAYSATNPQWHLPKPFYSKNFIAKDGTTIDLFVLDTDPINAEAEDYTHIQCKWLEHELKQSKANWKIVVGHHPMYSNGFHKTSQVMINAFEGIFVKYGVKMYLCGHNHEVHLLQPKNGVVHLCSGGGCTHHDTTWKDDTEFALTNLGYAWINFCKDAAYLHIHDGFGRVKFAKKYFV